jgi:FkbM family methyltransferase
MNSTIVSVSRSNLLRRTFRGLRLHRVYNSWLDRFPRTRTLPKSGTVYRARRTESVSLALEILEGGSSYDPSLLPPNYTTFADLGCNVGYFACWLAENASGRQIRGLMVDANPEVVEESRWHAKTNGWKDVHVLEGLVGTGEAKGTAEFYVYDANTCSTAQLGEAQLRDQHKFKKITVPIISFGEEWRNKMGNSRCNLLKIDIEGSELAFLQAETEFLKVVDVIFVEWHIYRVSFEQLKSFLEEHGFRFDRLIEEEGLNGTGCFRRV